MSRYLVGLLLGCSMLVSACGGSAQLPDFTELVEDTAPAIVNISGAVPVVTADKKPRAPWFEWFRDFADPDEQIEPGDTPEDSPARRSLGSGFIVSRDGEILTNDHLVGDASEIIVTLADQREFKARLIGRDPASDLALLKIEASKLPTLRFGSSEKLKVGEWVLAIGSPFGFEQTVTAGVVSGKRRSLRSEQYVPFLQTDVAINPGNSGGPLFNMDGRVVGINSQIFSQTGGYMGLSFAIPADTAVSVIRQLREFGEVRRAWLGVVIQKVDAALARSFGLPHASGALISHVDASGPAAAAGLRSGDVILEIDKEPVPNSGALPPMIGRHSPGERVRLGLLRDGKSLEVRVELAALPVENPRAAHWTGLSVEPLSAKARSQLNLDSGLLVRGVEEGSPGAAAGIGSGDILVNWAGTRLLEAKDLNQAAERLRRGESAALLVQRNNRSLYIALQRPQS